MTARKGYISDIVPQKFVISVFSLIFLAVDKADRVHDKVDMPVWKVVNTKNNLILRCLLCYKNNYEWKYIANLFFQQGSQFEKQSIGLQSIGLICGERLENRHFIFR